MSSPPRIAGAKIALNSERVEAIFELRWRLLRSRDGAAQRDPGFELLLGRLYERLRGQYSQLVELPAARTPIERAPYALRHCFTAADPMAPRVQVGPGVLVVSAPGPCAWRAFELRIQAAVAALFSAYPQQPVALDPAEVALCLVHAIPIAAHADSLLTFLREQLHTRLGVDPALFDDPAQAEKPVGLSFSLTFPLPRRLGLGTIAMATRPLAAGPCLVWQLDGRAGIADTPRDPKSLQIWASETHEVLAHWIRTLAPAELAIRLLEMT